ncbi:MAG: aminoacetone oxidase family FAD-binding enzyme [Candidatus Accumulibacter sp.]|nr:aminoacetone oxidase family FAD-binding enzyme [Accumulibacter sp.]
MNFDVIVIGAGAAGMMCAAEAGKRGRRVLLVDHAEKIGERIRISGGGRCNFTNRSVGPENYLSQNPHFCRSALVRFTPNDFIARLDARRIPWHEREHGQLFCDDSAQDIIDLLRDACADGGVQWVTGCAVERIEHRPEQAARFRLHTAHGRFDCAALVVATGGLSIPQIGASPYGYRIAEQFGLPVVAPRPALVPLALAPETLLPLKPLAGATLDARTACAGSGARFRENVLLTHRGLSGPAILQISSYWQQQAYHGKQTAVAIDLLPELDAAAWLAEHRHSRLLLPNLLAERLPRRFAHEWCRLVAGEKLLARPLAEIGKRDLEALAGALNGWALLPSGTLGYAKAEVTLGGVATDALSSKTMEAKAVPGLHFIGEVVDVTGWLGGYNFQWAWSSGWVAGQFA